MPYFSTAIFPSLETLRQRIEDVLAPLNYAVDQDVIALHVDLSAGASVLGVDRYWIVRFKYTHATLTICQQIESSASNSFPGTVRSQTCSVFGTLPAAVDLSVYLVSFLVALLPGFGTVNTSVIPPPVPANSPVITTLPADDPVEVHPGGNDPATTTAPDTTSVYGLALLWQDATGAEAWQVLFATTAEAADTLAAALQGLSNAIQIVQFKGIVTAISSGALTGAYPRLRDTGIITVQVPGLSGSDGEPLLVPAVLGGALLANQRTFDTAGSGWGDLAAAITGYWSRQSAGAATALIGGTRAPVDFGDEPRGGVLLP